MSLFMLSTSTRSFLVYEIHTVEFLKDICLEMWLINSRISRIFDVFLGLWFFSHSVCMSLEAIGSSFYHVHTVRIFLTYSTRLKKSPVVTPAVLMIKFLVIKFFSFTCNRQCYCIYTTYCQGPYSTLWVQHFAHWCCN